MSKEEVKVMFQKIRETFFPGSNHKAQDLFNIIEDMFRNMKLDLILLMRANVQMRSITKELGKPINRFAIMADYCLRGIYYERNNVDMLCQPHRQSDSKKVQVTHVTPTPFFHTLTYQLLKLKCSLFVVDVLFMLARATMTLKRFLGGTSEEEAEDRETFNAKRRLDRQKKKIEEDLANNKEDIEIVSTGVADVEKEEQNKVQIQ